MKTKALQALLVGGLVLASASAMATRCKLTNETQCNNYVKHWVKSLPKPGRNGYHYKVKRKMGKMARQLYACDMWEDDSNLKQFVDNRKRFFYNGMGMRVNNRRYLDNQEDTSKYHPEMMSIPQALITTEWDEQRQTNIVVDFPLQRMLESNFTSEEWLALEQQGYKHVSYTSRLVPNEPHGSMRRLLIFVPQDNFDRFIQVTLPDVTAPEANEALMDIIAIEKQNLAGETLEQPQIHFRQYWRQYREGELFSFARRNRTRDKCYQCHATGLRYLSPDPGSVVGETELTTLNELNAQMGSYGQLGWAGMFYPEAHGPIGETNGCTRCHGAEPNENTGFLGPITWTILQRNLDDDKHNSVALKMLQDLTMPPDTTLTAYHTLMRDLATHPLADEEATREQLRLTSQDKKYEAALQVLLENGRINEQQAEIVTNQVETAITDSKHAYRTLIQSSRQELTEWLQTSCSEQFSE